MTENQTLNIAVYTCNVGNYDIVLPPRVPANGIPFYCFTDQPRRRVAGWTMLPLGHPLAVRRPDLVNRYHKFFPHRILPGVNCSIYIDARIKVFGDLLPWVKKWVARNVAMISTKHPKRVTIFEEAERCIERGLFDEHETNVLRQQIAAYRAEGMPATSPLSQNGILLRFHYAPGLDEAMELWWQQLLRYTKRDQLSLSYVLWKTGLPTVLTDDISLHVYHRKAGLPTVFTDKNHCPPSPYFVIYRHRKHGLKGVWQRIHFRRYDVWWCDVLCRLERSIQPMKKVLKRVWARARP